MPVFAIAQQGSLAYAGSGSRVEVIDLSDPRHPVRVGASGEKAITPVDVAVDGNFLYVADHSSGLKIMDVSNPRQPVVTGTFAAEDAVQSVAVQGRTVYLTEGRNGLRIIDAQNPRQPLLRGTFSNGKSAQRVQVAGQYAYVGFNLDAWQIIDIGSPSQPVAAGRLTFSDQWQDFAVDGNTAYILTGTGTLRVIDLSDRAQPVEVKRIDLAEPAKRLRVISAGKIALSGATAALVILDLTDVNVPQVISTVPRSGEISSLSVAGGVALVSYLDQPMAVIDLSIPNQAAAVAAYGEVSPITGIAVDGSSLFLAQGQPNPDSMTSGRAAGMTILSATDPANPSVVGTWAAENAAQGIALRGSMVALANERDGLRLIDVTNPAHPVAQSVLGLKGWAKWVRWQPDLMLVGTTQMGGAVEMVNVDAVQAPRSLGELSCDGNPIHRLTMQGTVVHAAAGKNFCIIGLDDPLQPKLISSTPLLSSINAASEIVSDGKTAYVSYSNDRMRIIDLRDAEHPVLVDTLALYAEKFILQDHFLFVLDAFHKTAAIYRLDDAYHPELVAQESLNARLTPSDLALGNGYLYVSYREGGIQAWRFTYDRSVYLPLTVNAPLTPTLAPDLP